MSCKLFEPFACREEQIVITRKMILENDLLEWAEHFKMGTAGYRDLQNPEELFDMGVPFNPLTMAILTEAESRLYKTGDELHIGGEVRPWTQEYINLAARIYAAHGIICHLRGETDSDGPILTTPIWMSSFGAFYCEFSGGENFTASHSQNFKGGRKPMDGRGMQLLEGARFIQDEVKQIVRNAADGEAIVIHLAASDSPLIKEDFNVTQAYCQYLKSVIPEEMFEKIRHAGQQGFNVTVSTEGGSMGRTTRKMFTFLDIPTGPAGIVKYLHYEEDSSYYGIGIVDGRNHGVDPGKWQVYKNIGAQEILMSDESDVVFIWDPDGDRFNMVTTAPANLEGRARRDGLEVDPGDKDRCLVYYKPNQIYFMLMAFRLETYREMGLLEQYNWILMETYPTSRSLEELAARYQVPTFYTPVGFKHFGNALAKLEAQLLEGKDILTLTDTRGEVHTFSGPVRIFLMAEESGGASMGGEHLMKSRFDRNNMLALKEKDAFQVGVMAMALAADLKMKDQSFAEYYLNCLEKYKITYRHYERRDITLFDESLKGEERQLAMAEGNRKKEAAVTFFKDLSERFADKELNAGQVTRFLQERCVTGFVFPPVDEIFWAGDGTFIRFEQMWWQLRASGTDAVLRYYAEGEHKEDVRALNRSMLRLELGVENKDY